MKGSPSIFISEEKKNYYPYCVLLTKEFMDVTVLIFTGTTRNYSLKSSVILFSTYHSAMTNMQGEIMSFKEKVINVF